MSRFYLVLTVLGIAAPYAAFLPWLFTNGLNLPLLFEQAIANPISAMAWLDVVVAAVALIGFILVDGETEPCSRPFCRDPRDIDCWRFVWLTTLSLFKAQIKVNHKNFSVITKHLSQ